MTKVGVLLKSPSADGNFTVISNEEALLFQKLKQFYEDVCELTVNHDVVQDSAVVYPSKLGKLLEQIDTKWYVQALHRD